MDPEPRKADQDRRERPQRRALAGAGQGRIPSGAADRGKNSSIWARLSAQRQAERELAELVDHWVSPAWCGRQESAPPKALGAGPVAWRHSPSRLRAAASWGGM